MTLPASAPGSVPVSPTAEQLAERARCLIALLGDLAGSNPHGRAALLALVSAGELARHPNPRDDAERAALFGRMVGDSLAAWREQQLVSLGQCVAAGRA